MDCHESLWVSFDPTYSIHLLKVWLFFLSSLLCSRKLISTLCNNIEKVGGLMLDVLKGAHKLKHLLSKEAVEHTMCYRAAHCCFNMNVELSLRLEHHS